MTRRPVHVARCPICKAAADPAHRPFCSDRCAKVDLHRWLSDAYVVPGDAAAPDASCETSDDQSE